MNEADGWPLMKERGMIKMREKEDKKSNLVAILSQMFSLNQSELAPWALFDLQEKRNRQQGGSQVHSSLFPRSQTVSYLYSENQILKFTWGVT